MAVPIFHGQVSGGKIRFDRPDALREYVPTLEGKRVEMVLRREVNRRSSPQNKYFHGVVVPILADHCGYDTSAMKDALKWRFLRVSGPVDTVRHTSDLDAREFTEFVENCRMLGAELGVSIPGPNEVE